MTDLEDRQAESAAQAGSPDVSHTMNRHYRLALVGAVIAGLLLLPLVVFAVAEALNQGEIAPGVSAAGVPIGGLSPEDALEAMQPTSGRYGRPRCRSWCRRPTSSSTRGSSPWISTPRRRWTWR